MDHLNFILTNEFMKGVHEFQITELKNKFKDFNAIIDRNCLSVFKYLNLSPFCFYSELIFKKYYNWLDNTNNNTSHELKTYLNENDASFNRAILHLNEINRLDWHDKEIKYKDYELILFVDQHIHPTYLRLVEAVFTPLSRIVAFFSRLNRNKSTDDLNDLWSIVEEIKNTLLSDIISSYKHIARNGIAHGGITYLQEEIKYRDKKGNEETIPIRDMIRIFDDLLDSCNAMVLSLRLFLLTHQKNGYTLFSQFLIEELHEQTSNPWWDLIACTPSSISNLNQLIVYSKAKSKDIRKVQISVFQTGVLSEKFSSGYDRYFITLSSNSKLMGWASFDGKKLKNVREKTNVKLEDYMSVVDDNIIIFPPKLKIPKLISTLNTYFLTFKINIPILLNQLRKNFNRPIMQPRYFTIHRNSLGCVLGGGIFIKLDGNEITQNNIRNNKRKIITKIFKSARKEQRIFNILRYLPLGYARICVFTKNYRKRRLAGFGLDDDLACTIQIQRIRRIKSRDIMNSTIEQIGKYRIAWNNKWLNNISE